MLIVPDVPGPNVRVEGVGSIVRIVPIIGVVAISPALSTDRVVLERGATRHLPRAVGGGRVMVLVGGGRVMVLVGGGGWSRNGFRDHRPYQDARTKTPVPRRPYPVPT